MSKERTNPPETYHMICIGKTKYTSEKGLLAQNLAYAWIPSLIGDKPTLSSCLMSCTVFTVVVTIYDSHCVKVQLNTNPS